MKRKLALLSLLIILGCNTNETNKTNQVEIKEEGLDYKITDKNQIEWNDVFDQDDTRYSVYFYSERCGHCKIIKEEILSYYLSKKETMYFVNVTGKDGIYKSNDGFLIGVDNIEDFYIIGTPFLIEITNSTISNWYAGVDSIRKYIETMTT